ncbi:MAG: aldehyde dehydrogenase family protein, partial [Gammaproteobacteria bacterium]|nr:aldehyde dehydrogenase family protein [Gammaproteobacteria bacterium]
INGEWVDPLRPHPFEVENPATEAVIGRISLGSAADVDRAVLAARAAFTTYALTSRQERIDLLDKILAGYQERMGEIAATISAEMGAPLWLANAAQAPTGFGHLATTIKILKDFEFEQVRGNSTIIKEPAGVCGFITPWNWPMNQIMCKVAPALAAGCTMLLKPSEMTPLCALIVAEIMDQAGVPAGVFNLVNGDGPGVGNAIAEHADIDMVSFTGSTRAGVLVAQSAARSIKRVTQELGGKSANIILEDADLATAVKAGVRNCFANSGQSCNAPTRMLVHASQHQQALEIARATAESGSQPGDPQSSEKVLGPVASKVQFDKIQGLISKGIEEGATLVTGGLGKPEDLATGYFVKPTVFGNVTNDMTIAREEIFGPVLCILPYETEAQAIGIANDSDYGLAGYVQSGDAAHGRKVADQLRAGQVMINGAGADFNTPFGGYKQSGNGREWGVEGFQEFLEIKAVVGG